MAAKLDTWAFVPIGAPFPDKPMRVKGEQNMYVALWYKHGKPVQGRAWNNQGVVECSFGYNGKELTGVNQLGGDIQILTYEAPDEYEGYTNMAYWYEWVQYKDRQRDGLELCHCATVAPILGRAGNGQNMCGNIDMASETVSFSYDGREEKITDPRVIADMWIIARNLKPPPGWKGPVAARPKVHTDTWMDLKAGDMFPLDPVMALNKQLRLEDGTMVHQYVCLWYRHGQPIMGRCWKNAQGRLEATFAADGHQFAGNVGSLQVLAFTATRMSFNYQWLPFALAMNNYRTNASWQPMHVKDCAPIVMQNPTGGETLGMVAMSKERASIGWGGKEVVATGPPVANMMVLCRNPPQHHDPSN